MICKVHRSKVELHDNTHEEEYDNIHAGKILERLNKERKDKYDGYDDHDGAIHYIIQQLEL